MPKLNWLFCVLACAGVWSISLPATGQALLPYTPELNAEQLEQQGLQLAEEAIQLVRFQQYELALPRAKLATQLAPDRFEAWFILGSLYIQQEELDEGIKVLKTALTLAPEEAGIKFTLGNAYFQKGNYAAAATELEEGLTMKPDVPAALFDLGNAYLKLAKYSEAIESYEKAVAQDKSFWPAMNNIGLIEYEQGNIDEALERWQAAVAIDNEQAEPKLAVAIALFLKENKRKGLS